MVLFVGQLWYFSLTDSKISTIEEVQHEKWVGHPFYLKTSEDKEQSQNWPKVAMMKGIFEDMARWIYCIEIKIIK